MAIEATREIINLLSKNDAIRENFLPGETPASLEENDILEFWKSKASPSWHGIGTCRMGRSEDWETACVDESSQVYGINGLRVADLSIMPFSPRYGFLPTQQSFLLIRLSSTHPQALAYLIGSIAVDFIVGEN